MEIFVESFFRLHYCKLFLNRYLPECYTMQKLVGQKGINLPKNTGTFCCYDKYFSMKNKVEIDFKRQ